MDKVTLQPRPNHLFTDSTYVLGTGLAAKNILRSMELKFTFVGILQSDLVGRSLCVPQTLFTYTLAVIGCLLIHLSFPLRQTVLIYLCVLELGEEPGSVRFQSLFLCTFIK